MSRTATNPWNGGEIRGEGLVLRPWTDQDVPSMVSLFNTAEMHRWTPLAHPFNEVCGTISRASTAPV